jgi:RNA polymerase sigma factor (sigma-70 family)
LAAVPSIGRASRVEGAGAPEADLTRALYEQYANQIFRYCLHQLGSREEAEDAVQSTFLNAFRGIKRGIVPEIESAWLFKIAHNVCLSRRRSTWRRGRIESPTDFEVVEELAPAPSRRAEELIGLQDVLEHMPEQQRRAILLREWQGLSYREIAEELELSQAAVETLIFRARRSLAQGLEQPVQVQERKRARRAAGALGNLLSTAQSWLVGGGAAVKVAATVAVVSAGTVVASAPVHVHAPVQKSRKPAGAAWHSQAPVQVSGTSGVGVVPPVSAGGVQRRVAPEGATHARHVPAAPSAPLVAPTTASVAADPAVSAVAAPAPAPAAAPPVEQPQAQAPAPAAPAAPAQPARDDRPAAPVATTTATTTTPAAPAVPPGQAKKADPSPPAATTTTQDTPPALPPGQAKKADPAPPAVTTPQDTPPTPPGQAKKADPAPPVTTPQDTPPTPPGQAKKADPAPPAVTTPQDTSPPAPPGQAKKSDPAPPAATTTLPVQPPTTVAVLPPSVALAASVPPPAADNGKAKGKNK